MPQFTITRSELSELEEEDLRRRWRSCVQQRTTECGFEEWLGTQYKARKFYVTRSEQKQLEVEVTSHSELVARDRLLAFADTLDFEGARICENDYEVDWDDDEPE